MAPSERSPSESDAQQNGLFTPELLLSLATAPLLLGLIGGKVLSNVIQDLSVLSEEVFRGDRLPLLDISPASGSAQDEPPST